ncbi:MAG: hypothetical protein QNJ74_12755, partial [Trichodesmium sp. MO_231.B1]|nr:hypothetical protein [Trichodesmium sp. MO_231.B1]
WSTSMTLTTAVETAASFFRPAPKLTGLPNSRTFSVFYQARMGYVKLEKPEYIWKTLHTPRKSNINYIFNLFHNKTL